MAANTPGFFQSALPLPIRLRSAPTNESAIISASTTAATIWIRTSPIISTKQNIMPHPTLPPPPSSSKITRPRAGRPALLSATPTGIFPDWIPADQFVPNTPRIVLASDGEAIFTAVCETGNKRPFTDHIEWFNAATDDAFDSHIIAWMECPTPPEP